MFDKTLSFVSTDSSVSLTLVAGTEGVKSMTLHVGGKDYAVTPQKLLDIAAPGIQAYAAASGQ